MQISCSSPVILLLWLIFAHRLLPHAFAERSTYIVHMDKSSMPKAFATHDFWYSSLLESAKSTLPSTSFDGSKSAAAASNAGPRLVYTYDNAFHGFSAVVSKDELKALKNSHGFLSAYEDGDVTPDTTYSTDFLSLSSADGLWPAAAFGEDAIIGIIDTGVWPESPSFRDDGLSEVPARWKGICQAGEEFNTSLCNRKLIGARYFNEGARAANPDVIFTMNSARDTGGHGTHVASTAAGSPVAGVSAFGYAPGTARGAAPRARLAIYKVLWNEGSVESDALAAIDQAVGDGVDVISVSLSFRRNNAYEDPLVIAGFGAVEKGIVMSVSAGNRGPSIATLLGGVPWAIMVASGTTDRWFSGTVTLGNGRVIKGWSTYPARAVIRNMELYYNSTLSPCNSSEIFAEFPSGGIVVCDLTMTEHYFGFAMQRLAESFIGAGIIIGEDPTLFRSTSFSHPAVVLTPNEAKTVIDYATNSPSTPTATIDFQLTTFGMEPRAAPAVSDFSSRGPARFFEGILKPDIMAPGTLILAAYNPHTSRATIGPGVHLSTDYTLASGTSMSCPHISGVAALLKAVHPTWSPAAIQSAMMTTANHLDKTNQPIKDAVTIKADIIASPLDMGAGQVEPNRALDPGLIYDATPQDYVNLVCAMNFTREETLTIIRSSYNCSNPSMDLNYPSFIALVNTEEREEYITREFQRTVTNVGDGAAVYKAKVETPVNTTVSVSPTTLTFGKKDEKKKYSLTIRYRYDETFDRQGSITWIEENGNHTVRSPIVVTAGSHHFG